MLNLARAVTRKRKLILIVAVILLVPSALGFIGTRVNFDVLTYLPDSIETKKGQDILLEEFGKGAYGIISVEGMDYKDVAKLKEKMEAVDHVESILWFDTVLDVSVPKEMLPKSLYDVFNNDEKDATMMAFFLDRGTSEDESMAAVVELRKICGKQCFISSMTAFVEDLKEQTDKDIPIFIVLAVLLSSIVLGLFLESFMLPVIFVGGIGMEILYNMGSNIVMGEISYITMAVAAVLQLGVTMDYSIFLWHSYKEQKLLFDDRDEAMANAISKTLVSIAGSSITTIAGFLALCFMTFTLGLDLGIVMAKGVVFGIIGSVTILPSLILTLEPLIDKTTHRALMPKFDKITSFVVNNPKKMLVLFVVVAIPALYGYANAEEYYKLDESVPQTMPFAVANKHVEENFGLATTYMMLADANTSGKDMTDMVKEIQDVEGIDKCLGLKSVTGGVIPDQIIPIQVSGLLQNENWQVLLITSEYAVASDEVNEQIAVVNDIMDKYDEKAMLIGEAPCTKDLISITNHDFKVVNFASIFAILLIIMLVLKSFSLPFILVAVIELAIFINLGIPCYTGTKLAFIAGIIISTVQLGSTVDYAILMTTRYKMERLEGHDAKDAVTIAHKTSMPSIMVSALAFFAATIGVGIYSEVDIIGSLCTLMARGALISMFVVMLILPSALVVFDKVIIKTSRGMKARKMDPVAEGGESDEIE